MGYIKIEIKLPDLFGGLEISIQSIFESADVQLQVLPVALRWVFFEVGLIGGVGEEEFFLDELGIHQLGGEALLKDVIMENHPLDATEPIFIIILLAARLRRCHTLFVYLS